MIEEKFHKIIIDPNTDPKLLETFVPFSKDSGGEINSLFYYRTDNWEGDIVIDCNPFLPFFWRMHSLIILYF